MSSRAPGTDDAIHAMDLRGRLLCGLPVARRRAIGLEGFPRTDVGGAYCWTCLQQADAAEREVSR